MEVVVDDAASGTHHVSHGFQVIGAPLLVVEQCSHGVEGLGLLAVRRRPGLEVDTVGVSQLAAIGVAALVEDRLVMIGQGVDIDQHGMSRVEEGPGRAVQDHIA